LCTVSLWNYLEKKKIIQGQTAIPEASFPGKRQKANTITPLLPLRVFCHRQMKKNQVSLNSNLLLLFLEKINIVKKNKTYYKENMEIKF
jgi:hypothetical protein